MQDEPCDPTMTGAILAGIAALPSRR